MMCDNVKLFNKLFLIGIVDYWLDATVWSFVNDEKG